MTSMTNEFGYRSTGETLSIADTKEARIMELIGSGRDGDGVAWVARKAPEGRIRAHANKARIGAFPLDDPDNCLYSPNVVEFAVQKGCCDPSSRGPFRRNEAYCPSTPQNQRYASARVWSILRRVFAPAGTTRTALGLDDFPAALIS